MAPRTMWRPHNLYSQLPNDDNSGYSPDSELMQKTRQDKRPNRFLIWCCAIALTVTLLNLSFLSILRQSKANRDSRRGLRRPSTYIGFDSIERSASWPLPGRIANHPRTMQRVSASEPDRVFPQDRHVLVSSQTSMLVQFRVRDYDMERCTVGIWIPPKTALRAGKTFELEGDLSSIELWKINLADELDFDALTWRSRPRDRILLGALDITAGVGSRIPTFACPTESLLTFEVSCPEAATDCFMEFGQDQSLPVLGIMMYQYSSLSSES